MEERGFRLGEDLELATISEDKIKTSICKVEVTVKLTKQA